MFIISKYQKVNSMKFYKILNHVMKENYFEYHRKEYFIQTRTTNNQFVSPITFIIYKNFSV